MDFLFNFKSIAALQHCDHVTLKYGPSLEQTRRVITAPFCSSANPVDLTRCSDRSSDQGHVLADCIHMT